MAAKGAQVWHAYLEVAEPVSWFNNQTYVDTLNRDAIERFIEVTHERYYREVGESFGKSTRQLPMSRSFATSKVLPGGECRMSHCRWTDDFQPLQQLIAKTS